MSRSIWERDERMQPGTYLLIDDFVVSTERVSCDTRVEYGGGSTDINGERRSASASPTYDIAMVRTGNGFLVRCLVDEIASGPTVSIYTQTWQKLRTLALARECGNQAAYSVQWDGRTDAGNLCAGRSCVAVVETGSGFRVGKMIVPPF